MANNPFGVESDTESSNRCKSETLSKTTLAPIKFCEEPTLGRPSPDPFRVTAAEVSVWLQNRENAGTWEIFSRPPWLSRWRSEFGNPEFPVEQAARNQVPTGWPTSRSTAPRQPRIDPETASSILPTIDGKYQMTLDVPTTARCWPAFG